MNKQNETVTVQQGEWRVLTPAVVGVPDQQVRPVWTLVLAAKEIPYQIDNDQSGLHLLVPEERLAEALHQIRLYEEENHNWPPPLPPARELDQNILVTLSVLILLAAFHNLIRSDLLLINETLADWFSLGMAQAGRIRGGESWRLVTALTLHADLQHLLGNLVIGGLFVFLLCREIGTGLSWFLLLVAGSLGNLANGYVQLDTHNSVGASTAVFGVVGILAGLSVIRYRQHLRHRWPLPIGGAVALLVVLGSEGSNTDLGAHLFGFLFGVPLGLITELLISRFGQVGRVVNMLLGLFSILIVVGAWWVALAGRV